MDFAAAASPMDLPAAAPVEGRDGKKSEHYVAKMDDEKKPFRVYLDVGIRVTTTGARIFGAMKGATDGGLDIPHNEKRFPGYNRDNKKCVPGPRALPSAVGGAPAACSPHWPPRAGS
jgi:hypothetical protein